jgi:hypothetical protein
VDRVQEQVTLALKANSDDLGKRILTVGARGSFQTFVARAGTKTSRHEGSRHVDCGDRLVVV